MGKPRTIKGRAREVARRLAEEYPAECALVHQNPFELAVATVLSAQTTDERVNMVTPELFRRWPTPADLAKADPEELEGVIFPTGFYRNKAKSLLGLAQALEDNFGGEVPTALEDLVTLRDAASVLQRNEMVRRIEEETAVNEARMEMALGNVDQQRVKIEEEAEKLKAEELVKQFKAEMGLISPGASAGPVEKTIGGKEGQRTS